jgi:hypothetical protein
LKQLQRDSKRPISTENTLLAYDGTCSQSVTSESCARKQYYFESGWKDGHKLMQKIISTVTWDVLQLSIDQSVPLFEVCCEQCYFFIKNEDKLIYKPTNFLCH